MQQKKWWKEAVAYQIYPRSFRDSNGDGIGDLRGILEKLDYLQYLGVNVIWLCPMYKSPQDDNGYDISDYQGIQPEYGTMQDFDDLLAGLHQRGMKLLIDLVVNHTSDEHPWFVESRSSKESPKRNWYWWRDGKQGKEPNNWESIFGGSAWELDEKTAQYYLHLFSRKQPDLYWDDPEMRQAIYKMIRWWLDRGVDGFRIDAISHMKKEPTLADLPNPKNLPYVPSFASHMNIPGIHAYIDELCQETFQHYDIMTVGEANGVNSRDAELWVGEARRKFNMLFQFEHLDLWSTDPHSRINIPKLKEVLSRWQKDMHGRGWNALYLENHDIPRITSKWGEDKFWQESATCFATLYFLMQGTPFIYQGQEIGMTNTIFRKPEDFDDVRDRNSFSIQRKAGVADSEILAKLAPLSRDNARTPMQWDATANAGFGSGKPWLAVNPNYPSINVAAQIEKPGSVLEHYRELIRLRGSELLWIYGSYELVWEDHPQVFAYRRQWQGKSALVVCNLTNANAVVGDLSGKKILGNYPGEPTATLRPFEALVLEA